MTVTCQGKTHGVHIVCVHTAGGGLGTAGEQDADDGETGFGFADDSSGMDILQKKQIVGNKQTALILGQHVHS